MSSTMTLRRWVWLHSAGWLLGVVAVIMLSSLLDMVGIEHWQFHIGLGMGLAMGATQAFALRRQSVPALRWIAVSVAALTAPFAVSHFLLPSAAWYTLPICILSGATLLSCLQERILRRSGITGLGWCWLLGWTLAALFLLAINATMMIRPAPVWGLVLAVLNLLLILAGGPVLGWVTGKGMRESFTRNTSGGDAV
jgi:hypothetical protein